MVVSGKELGGKYVGEAQSIVLEKMRQAKGGILLIDEAYGMASTTSYSRDVIDSLVYNFTLDEFKGNLIFILAGYAHEMTSLLRNCSNPGFASRFEKQVVNFEPWTPQQCTDAIIARYLARQCDFTMAAKGELLAGFTELHRLPGFASARDVMENVPAKMDGAAALRRKREAEAAKAARAGAGGEPADAPHPAAARTRTYTEGDVRTAMAALAAMRSGGIAAAQAAGLRLPGGDGINGGVLQMAEPQTRTAPPPMKQQYKYVEPPQVEVPGDRVSSESEDQAAIAQLMELCISLGYDSAATLAFCDKCEFPENVVAAYMEKVGEKDAATARTRLRTQGPKVSTLIKALLKQQEKEKNAHEAKVQEVLLRIGKCCMGFDWLKEGDGYRCAGGSHTCSAADVAAAMSEQ